ncbi:calpastatin-like [Eucyclogobius newberryi]|uniref:calpastatin-like n=1 Tax=Eucyclogobius newberryi TaxID=166745 RepID=UPI003B59E727
MSTDDALDVLSFGFVSETSQKNVETISASSKAPANFAPAPPANKKVSAPPADRKVSAPPADRKVSAPPADRKVSAPPADRKVSAPPADRKVSAPPADRKVSAPPADRKVSAPPADRKVSAPPAERKVSAPPADKKVSAPPADKKPKLDSAADSFSLSAAVPTAKASSGASSSSEAQSSSVTSPVGDLSPSLQGDMSFDALSALEDLLPSAEPPKPEAPLRPEDLVSEATVEEEEGVRVGEREDTLPPEYRLKPEELSRSRPAPQPSLNTADALDLLSGDFSCSSAPSTHSAAPAPCPCQDTVPAVQTLSALDSLSQDFVSSSKMSTVQAPAPPPSTKATQVKTQQFPQSCASAVSLSLQGDLSPSLQGDMSFDALSALEDLLPSAEPPKPEAPLRPEDLVSEATVEEEEGVRVGEREDTLPPEYRLKPEELSRSRPAPQPSLNTADALDLLSGDFSCSSAPSTHSAAPAPVQSAAEAALDLLSGDFIAPSAAPTVQSSARPPQAPLEAGSDSALDALSDSLKDIAPTPQPEPPMPKNIVKEKKIEEERLIKMGERDDSLPPEYRPTEEELQKMAKEKKKEPKEKPMDDKTALDLLAGDFSAPVSSSAPVSFSAPVSSAPTHVNKPMPGKVLDSLYDTLLPESPEPKKTEQSKAKSKSRSRSKMSQAEGAVDLPSSQRSSDVVATSTKKS